MMRGLQDVITRLEADAQVKVVVFDSAVPDYFCAHFDLTRAKDTDHTLGPTGLSPWPDFATRLARLPVVSVAVVRGRARGIGSEVALAMDVRFASREKAVFGQFEVGAAAIPGGGGMERLHALMGRARTIEAVIGADDFDAATAERYGWINRAVPDAELDAFVERFATRVASFDRDGIVIAKDTLNRLGGVPTPDQLRTSEKSFFGLLSRPYAATRIGELFKHGLQQVGELERSLGDRIGPPGPGDHK
jgi:enoyl-CoA hydratase/carnithine racemase